MRQTARLKSCHSQRGWAWLAAAAPYIGAAVSAAGAAATGDSSRKSMHEQMDAQREFAQMGIRWKVADAKAAGIHPLYALGANTTSYSPVSVGDTGVGTAMSGLGQDLSRAYAANQSREERETALAKAAFRQSELDAQNRAEHQARLEGLQLDNEAKRMENRDKALGLTGRNTPLFQQLNAPTQVGPGFPSAVASPVEDHRGRVDAGAITLKPVEQISRDPNSPNRESGSHPGFKRVEVAPGQYMDVPTFQTDAEIPQTLREMYAYWRKWVSDSFFNGAPKYINIPNRRRGYEGRFHKPVN